MARRLRLEFEGAIYHVTSRGSERSDVFSAKADKVRFLEKLAENVEQHHLRLYAYVVMTNFRLLVETPRANLTRYLHLNPVKIESFGSLSLREKAAKLRQYAWSSYPGYVGLRKRLEWVDYGPLLWNWRGGGARSGKRRTGRLWIRVWRRTTKSCERR